MEQSVQMQKDILGASEKAEFRSNPKKVLQIVRFWNLCSFSNTWHSYSLFQNNDATFSLHYFL